MNRSPLKFFLLVFALSIPIWLIGAMAERGLRLPMNLPVSALQAFCPLTAALILVYGEDSIRGVRRLLTRVVDYKRIRPKIWYVPIIFLATYPLSALLCGNAPDGAATPR